MVGMIALNKRKYVLSVGCTESKNTNSETLEQSLDFALHK